MPGNVVDLLAKRVGSRATDTEVAQRDLPIGAVQIVHHAIVTRSFTAGQLSIGDRIFRNDVIETDSDGQIGVSLTDQTVFVLQKNTRLAIEKFEFDDSQGHFSVYTLIEGSAAFVPGKIADAGGMQIITPVAIFAVRGATGKGVLKVSFDAHERETVPQGQIDIFPNSDGRPPGKVDVYSLQGGLVGSLATNASETARLIVKAHPVLKTNSQIESRKAEQSATVSASDQRRVKREDLYIKAVDRFIASLGSEETPAGATLIDTDASEEYSSGDQQRKTSWSEQAPEAQQLLESEEALRPEELAPEEALEPKEAPEPELTAAPEPQQLLEPEKAPEQTLGSEEVLEPKEAPEPELTAAPEPQQLLEPEKAPEQTLGSEEALEPKEAPEPELTAAPEPQQLLEPEKAPEQTLGSEEALEPKEAPEPELTAAPEPQQLLEPEEALRPEELAPEEALEPKEAPEPELTAAPEPQQLLEPEKAPEQTLGSEEVLEPKEAPEPELTAAPEPQQLLEPEKAPEQTLGSEEALEPKEAPEPELTAAPEPQQLLEPEKRLSKPLAQRKRWSRRRRQSQS